MGLRMTKRFLVVLDWITCLDILSIALEEENNGCVGLNGQITLAERSRTIDAFQDKTDPNAPDVLLNAPKCGTYGLTLTAASTVIMLNTS